MSTVTTRAPGPLTDALLAGMELFDDAVARVRDDDWHRPTPCADWTVAHLVDHTADTAARATAFLQGETWQASTSTASPSARWASRSAVLREGLSLLDVDQRWPLPADAPHAKLLFHACDFAVHRWDLLVALDAEEELPEAWVAFMDRFFHSQPADVLRRPRAFGAPREPAAGDGPTRRLMAFLGRRP